jgi:hypothetical protein
MTDILDQIKLEHFEDGLTQEEKFNLARDLAVMHSVVENHDRSVFQLIAGFNVLQKTILDAGIVTEEVFQKDIKDEILKLENIFLEKVAERDKEQSEQE